MPAQLTSDPEALRLFFTEDIYLIPDEEIQKEAIIENKSPNPAPEVEKVTENTFNFLGGNGRNILVLMNDPIHPEGNTGDMAFLWRILGAIKLTVQDCAVLNVYHHPGTDFNALATFFKPQAFLSFGVDAVSLGLPRQDSSALIQHNNIHLICSPPLAAIGADVALKTLLWKSLQQLTLS
jgi:hypothetical protein